MAATFHEDGSRPDASDAGRRPVAIRAAMTSEPVLMKRCMGMIQRLRTIKLTRD